MIFVLGHVSAASARIEVSGHDTWSFSISASPVCHHGWIRIEGAHVKVWEIDVAKVQLQRCVGREIRFKLILHRVRNVSVRWLKCFLTQSIFVVC